MNCSASESYHVLDPIGMSWPGGHNNASDVSYPAHEWALLIQQQLLSTSSPKCLVLERPTCMQHSFDSDTNAGLACKPSFMRTHTHIHTHTRARTHTHLHTHAYMQAHPHRQTCKRTHTHIRAVARTSTHTLMRRLERHALTCLLLYLHKCCTHALGHAIAPPNQQHVHKCTFRHNICGQHTKTICSKRVCTHAWVWNPCTLMRMHVHVHKHTHAHARTHARTHTYPKA